MAKTTIHGNMVEDGTVDKDAIVAGDLSGADDDLMTGTAGTASNFAMFDANGDLVDSTVAIADALVSSDIGSSVQGFDADILKADVSDNLTVGFTSNAFAIGTVTSGAVTPSFANSNFQTLTNGGAFTLNELTGNGTMILDIVNNASAGAINVSGWDLVTGDSFTTTNGHVFRCYISRIGTRSHLHVQAFQ
jgi:hypothetical protein